MRERSRVKSIVGLVLGTVAALAVGAPAQAATLTCSGDPSTFQTLDITSGSTVDHGFYSMPAGTPKGIVVVGHGYPQTALSVAPLLPGIAQRDGVIALAMDYHGTVDVTPTTSRGWRVQEGADDSIAAAKLFESMCGVTGPITAFGISMGGNMTGIAVAAHAKRSTGAPLFDYWFDVSGVTDALEIYADATAISLAPIGSIQTLGVNAKADLEQEMGGNPLLKLGTYLNRSPVTRAGDMRSSGLKGVVIAHGVVDGEVTSDMSVQMASALAVAGIATDISVSVFKNPSGPPGLTLDGDVLGLIPGYVSPFAGHVQTVVLNQALAKLDALYQAGQVPTGTKLTLVDGALGTFPLL